MGTNDSEKKLKASAAMFFQPRNAERILQLSLATAETLIATQLDLLSPQQAVTAAGFVCEGLSGQRENWSDDLTGVSLLVFKGVVSKFIPHGTRKAIKEGDKPSYISQIAKQYEAALSSVAHLRTSQIPNHVAPLLDVGEILAPGIKIEDEGVRRELWTGMLRQWMAVAYSLSPDLQANISQRTDWIRKIIGEPNAYRNYSQ